jgi:hypothetical protein
MSVIGNDGDSHIDNLRFTNNDITPGTQMTVFDLEPDACELSSCITNVSITDNHYHGHLVTSPGCGCGPIFLSLNDSSHVTVNGNVGDGGIGLTVSDNRSGRPRYPSGDTDITIVGNSAGPLANGCTSCYYAYFSGISNVSYVSNNQPITWGGPVGYAEYGSTIRFTRNQLPGATASSAGQDSVLTCGPATLDCIESDNRT